MESRPAQAEPQRRAEARERFLNAHPDIDVNLQELSSDAVLEALRRGTADLGIVADRVDTTGLTSRPWIADELVALLPAPRRIPERQPALSYVQLLDRPFVGLPVDRGLSRFLMQQVARSGRMPHHRVRVGTFDAVASLVAAGVGVAVMPRSAALRRQGPRTRVVPLKDGWAQRTLLVCSTAQAPIRLASGWAISHSEVPTYRCSAPSFSQCRSSTTSASMAMASNSFFSVAASEAGCHCATSSRRWRRMVRTLATASGPSWPARRAFKDSK